MYQILGVGINACSPCIKTDASTTLASARRVDRKPTLAI